MLPQHRHGVVGLGGGPLEPFKGDGVRTEGMPQPVLRPGNDLGGFSCVLERPLDVNPRFNRSCLPRETSQPGSQISRYLDQLPAAILTFGVRKIDKTPVQLYLAPVEPGDFFPPQAAKSRQREVRNKIGRGTPSRCGRP